MPELDWTDMPIHEAIKADWKTPEILIEGSLNCAKTTLWLDKEIDALFKYPKIKILLFRWSQDSVDTKLRPAFEEVLAIRGIPWTWDDKKKRYTFDNGSIAYMFGLKTVSIAELMSKIRGLGVSRASGDQVEELDQAVAGELRGRMRPDLTTTVIDKIIHPFQITFVSNSEDDDFWLSKEFPVDNHIKGRKVFQLSVFDNKHLPQESIDSLLRQYPPDHPRHRTMVLGRRGPRVYGIPVFEGLYRKDLHWRAVSLRHDMPILESFEMGKHNPCWVFVQAMAAGGLSVHGAILALGMILEDFLPIVQEYRRMWYPVNLTVKTCVAPHGEKAHATGNRFTGIDVLKKTIKKIAPIWEENGNAPDVRLAMIENISGYLRRRNARGDESFAVNNDPTRFLIVSKEEGERESPIVHHALEGGYSWDKHFVSVSNKELRQPREDDKFANVMHCIENIELNFCAGRLSSAERSARIRQSQQRSESVPTARPTGKARWMA